MSYEDLKNKHPELNWSEAENEIDDSDLDAASDMFDKLVSERKVKVMIQETIQSIKEQTGLELRLCDHFTGIRTGPTGSYFNVVLKERVAESAEYVRLDTFARRYKTIRIEPNGSNRVAIFPLNKKD